MSDNEGHKPYSSEATIFSCETLVNMLELNSAERLVIDQIIESLKELGFATYVHDETQSWINNQGGCWNCHQIGCYDNINLRCNNCGIYRHMEWRQDYYEDGDETLYYRTIPFKNPRVENPDFEFPEMSVTQLCPCGSGKQFNSCHGKK
jgi:hypothetical protein